MHLCVKDKYPQRSETNTMLFCLGIWQGWCDCLLIGCSCRYKNVWSAPTKMSNSTCGADMSLWSQQPLILHHLAAHFLSISCFFFFLNRLLFIWFNCLTKKYIFKHNISEKSYLSNCIRTHLQQVARCGQDVRRPTETMFHDTYKWLDAARPEWKERQWKRKGGNSDFPSFDFKGILKPALLLAAEMLHFPTEWFHSSAAGGLWSLQKGSHYLSNPAQTCSVSHRWLTSASPNPLSAFFFFFFFK